MKKNRFSKAALLLAAMTVFSVGCADKGNGDSQIAEERVTAATTVSSLPSFTAVSEGTASVSAYQMPVTETTASTAVSTAVTTKASTAFSAPVMLTSTSAALVPTASTAPAANAVLQPQEETKEFLNCNITGEFTKIVAGLGPTIVLQCTENKSSVCYVYDIAFQKIIREIRLEHQYDEVNGVLGDGTIVVCSYTNGNRLYFYPEGTEEPNEVNLTIDYIPTMYVDQNENCVYYADGNSNSVMKVEPNGAICTAFTNDCINYINDIDTNRKLVHASAYSENALGGIADCYYSLETRECVYSLQNEGMSFFSANDQIINLDEPYPNPQNITNLHIYDAAGNYQHTYSVPHKKKTDLFICGYENPACDYIPVQYENGSSVQEFYFIDLKNGTLLDSGMDMKKNKFYSLTHCYLKYAGCWITVANCVEGKKYTFKLIKTYPEMLKTSKQLKTEVKEFTKNEPVSVGKKYRAVRNKADELEKEFGIRILVGNEVKSAEYGSSYKLISSEKYIDSETEIYNLNDLRNTLAAYPKDFFKHFKLSNGEFGLRISLVDHLQSEENTSFVAAGVAYQSGAWYDIAFQSSYCWDPTMMHHEIWHQVERLNNKTQSINEDEWSKLNPQKFKYIRDFDKYATKGADLTYTMPAVWETEVDYSIPYFARDYSLVTPMEDRATLIERLFNYDGSWNEDNQPVDAVEEMNKFPHIKAKLDFLAEISKNVFGYVYWEEMLKAS